MRSRVGPVAVAFVLLLACDSSSGGEAPVKAAENKPAAAQSAEAKSTDAGVSATDASLAEKCPSFEGLDVATLPPLPEGPHMEVLDQVWRRVLEKYYEPTIGCLDWPAIRAEYGAKVAAAETPAEAYRLMNEMLGRLEQSHFQLHAPGGSGDETQGPASPSFQVRYIDEALLVVDSDVASVKTGSALVAVDGRSTTELVERAKKKSDRPAELAFFAARGAAAWISCSTAGGTHALTFERPSGKTFDTTVACKAPKGELVTLGNLSNVPTRVSHRMVEGTSVGVLAFNVWMLPMLPRIRHALQALNDAGMKSLALDLRGNPGGVGPMAVSVARLLLAEKASLGRLQYRKMTQDFKLTPDPGAFAGPIVVLVDEGTASTSEIFAAGMRDLGRVTVVGGGPSAGRRCLR
ncbi:MAG: hypothetical protein JKY37_09600 [Nannocystaceae bacterium]|nr:hypothetical protein [Nannocystaceae bacterium]